jgi:ribonuclease HI
MTCITINTDASYHIEKKVGGYAFYIVCDLFKIRKGGMFKNSPANSTEAEMMSIANAIATLLAQKELPKVKWLIINTDSIPAITRIKKAARTGNDLDKQVWLLLRKLNSRLSAKSKIRHVKAHSKMGDARSKANEWCDTEAKKWMREAVKATLSSRHPT